jgi:hypothetical protein
MPAAAQSARLSCISALQFICTFYSTLFDRPGPRTKTVDAVRALSSAD